MSGHIKRLTAEELHRQLESGQPPRLLDVRRSALFTDRPYGLPGAIPLFLDVDDPVIPDLPRDTPIVAYCLCTGEASSTRVGIWLLNSGYEDVSLLIGGLGQWEASGYETLPLVMKHDDIKWMSPAFASAEAASQNLSSDTAMVPLLAEESFLSGMPLPMRRDMAVLFVDMVDSTPMLFRHSTERVLEIVQTFMAAVVDVAVHHCGDVHDFEGDGAMLYFAGAGEAVPAAFRLREALNNLRAEDPDIPRARYAIDAGPLIVGRVGSRYRQSLSFIGPCVNRAARILKLSPPGAIAVTGEVMDCMRKENPDLAVSFELSSQQVGLKGMGDRVVDIYMAVQ